MLTLYDQKGYGNITEKCCLLCVCSLYLVIFVGWGVLFTFCFVETCLWQNLSFPFYKDTHTSVYAGVFKESKRTNEYKWSRKRCCRHLLILNRFEIKKYIYGRRVYKVSFLGIYSIQSILYVKYYNDLCQQMHCWFKKKIKYDLTFSIFIIAHA